MKKGIVVFGLMLVLTALALMPSAAQDSVPWWNNRVFYEIFVRSFYDSDGDGIGDLQGIIQKLDYLNDGDPTTTTDLGVTGLWLMPVAESPSYHGYDVTDYLMIEPDYGTDDDFRALVAAAHERGIAVIVDLVVNHTSREHPWFQASAAGNPHYANWYIWDESCPTYRGPWGEVVWIPLDDRCYYAIFWEGMPDLNYTNSAVTSAMENVAHYWLTDMGADGFRLDALQHIIENGQNQANTDATHEWANAFHDTITSVKPDALSVGEIDANSYLAAPYVPDGADLVFAFDLADAMLQSANVGSNSAVTTLQNRVVDLYPPNQYAAFLSNHDDNRSINTLRHSVDKAKAAATLLLTQPGVPFIYYGEEIGMSGVKPDERIRTPMQWDATERTAGFTSGTPWEPLQNDIGEVNVAAQFDDPDSLLSRYRDLIHLRNAHPALLHGDYVPVASSVDEVYSFLRRSADETLLVVINLSGESITDYALSLDAGLPGASASPVFGAPEAAAPVLNADGGFADYVPVPELAPYSLTVIAFTQYGVQYSLAIDQEYNMRRSILACLTTLLVLVYASAPVAFAQDARTPADICASEVPALEPANRTFTAPEQVLQPGVDYRAILCTDVGEVYVDLFEGYTPITVNSFVFLAQNRYYNNTTFHRVLQDFMAQGGDPTGTGRGGPGYSFVNEPVGFLNFDSPGWLAMANAGADTNGSQFFITTVPYPSLNYNYTIFGEVLEGQENVDAIRLRDPDTATEPGTALNTVVIITDPATVQTTYVAPTPASREDVQTVLDALNGGLPESIQVDSEYSGIFDTAQTAQFAPGDLSGDFAVFLETHHHEYRAADRVTNAQCDLNAAPFVSIGYTLDRFATPEDAAAALADSFLPQLESASGYTATDVEGLAYPLYTQTRTVCDQQVTDALTYWQRGHFVATLQAVFPADHPIPPERWLTELVGVSTFERIFSDVLRREIR